MRLKYLLPILPAFCALSAHALQVVDGLPGQNVNVNISSREITVIRIQQGRIASLFATDGELSVTKDEDTGQLFVRPLILDKPINIRVISQTGQTYNMILKAIDIPQEDVEIREPGHIRPSPYSVSTRTTASILYKGIQALVSGMATDRPPSYATQQASNRTLKFWDDTRLALIAIFTASDMIGEKYTLSNFSKEVIRLEEQEFYKKGVLAVSIENHELVPGQTTFVYVVREPENGSHQ